ncbi:hypothetical protein BN1708_002995 [Verticillium longisporum]|uniref:Uncharacterized protein n=2 Tax=Verticillium longisporum TaxID=100787 RepID=A0A0G4L6U6_VERLO|nr:hypothetical protein BN1708_002995 [Verticillium longisporum]
MEESPLTKAHDHARAAANASTTVAINEHTLAAGEFANAAQSTTSIEALRTLKLLEEHHLRLSELLKLPVRRLERTESDEKQANNATEITNDATSKGEQPATAPPAKTGPVPSLFQSKRYQAARPMTSSIASNLASARGIKARDRGQLVPPSVSNDQAPGNLEVSPRSERSRSKMQNRSKEPEAEETAAAPSDDGYSRFYNTFGTIMNRLSAPLAFAGLPLIAEESALQEVAETWTPEASPPVKRTKHKSPAPAAEPDLSRIYSRATMRAMSGQNPNESFYVVPTSGHTMSYANILNFADKEKRRMDASLHVGGDSGRFEDDEDDFVDARDTPVAPPSPTKRRGRGTMSHANEARSFASGSHKTAEELAMENKSLKDVLDKLSRRLHAFEASAQNSSLALAESMRFRRPTSPLATSAGGPPSGPGIEDTTALKAKNKELEEQMALTVQRIEALEKENQKMERTLAKYREKWEKLKAGAKARREAQGSVENAAVEEDPGTSEARA